MNLRCDSCGRIDCMVEYWRGVVARRDAKNAAGIRVAKSPLDAVAALSSAELLCHVRRLIALKVAEAIDGERTTRTRTRQRARKR